jgi:hypothetical protein
MNFISIFISFTEIAQSFKKQSSILDETKII